MAAFLSISRCDCAMRMFSRRESAGAALLAARKAFSVCESTDEGTSVEIFSWEDNSEAAGGVCVELSAAGFAGFVGSHRASAGAEPPTG